MNAIRIHFIAFLSVAILCSCGREEADATKAEWRFQDGKSHSLDSDQMSARPFALTTSSSERGMTLEQYVNALYRETAGRGATSSETQHWVKQYASGRGIQDIVNGVVSSTSSASDVMNKLESKYTVEQGEREKGRGFGMDNYLLFYFLSNRGYSNHYTAATNLNSFLPFFMSSRQYTKYLFWSYVLTGSI